MISSSYFCTKLIVTAEQGHVVYNKILLQHYLNKAFGNIKGERKMGRIFFLFLSTTITTTTTNVAV